MTCKYIECKQSRPPTAYEKDGRNVRDMTDELSAQIDGERK